MSTNGSSKTLFEKIWNQHVVVAESGNPAVLYIDLHLIHEVTSPQAFTGLREKGLTVRRPSQVMATMDHGIPTTPPDIPITDQMVLRQISQLEKNCEEFGIPLQGMHSDHRGIVHVIGPELGLTQPGMTVVCGDSHTSTHGAFGALAFGIGTSEIEHVFATQCLLQVKPKTYAIKVDGTLGNGVSAKDIILNLISRIGIGGGTGYVFEYMGSAIRALSMEERMTVCNMSIEGGARAGLVAPDNITYDYIAGRKLAPQDEAWDKAVAQWRTLPSDEGATFDQEITIDADALGPMITYGTNPGMGMGITDTIPDPDSVKDVSERQTLDKALKYMDIQPGQQLLGQDIDVVFLGSCTNSRISDLRVAANLIKGRKVADSLRMMVVPGSQDVKNQAENEGLDVIFKEAGAEWREAGCSMCIAMNGDQLSPGQYAVSTSNRNFEGRQGKGGRTFLASPLTATATAITGKITDVRTML
ncbi:3-isopropylmalate dehydratase large subunit [Anaerolineales bacterium HSG25]|nr:3-isopropylmalate dehydratase large subunit [Anaerolineales bacterium HSG25]